MSEGDTIPLRGSADMWRSRAKAAEAENQRLQAEVARLREALERLLKACPQALSCDDFAHTRNTFHNYDEPCEPQIEYLAAQDYARAALEEKP